MPLAFSDSATVGTTLMLRLRNASTTVASPAPVCRPIAVAPVTWYHNGEPSAHRSAFCVTEVSALAIDQYGSQPLTIRRGRLSALAAGPPASSPRARSDAASAQQTRAALRRRACMDLSRVRVVARPLAQPGGSVVLLRSRRRAPGRPLALRQGCNDSHRAAANQPVCAKRTAGATRPLPASGRRSP